MGKGQKKAVQRKKYTNGIIQTKTYQTLSLIEEVQIQTNI